MPPPGHLRTMAWGTVVNTVGTGLWYAGAALYLTRGVGLPATSVGLGLTIAGLVGLTASVPLGRLADRRDPRSLRALLQVLQAAVAAAYLLVDSFGVFLVVAVLDALLVAGNLTVRSALVAAVGGPAGRVQAFATLHAVADVGIGIGAALAGIALAVDTPAAYAMLVAGNAVTYLISAGLLMRLPPYPPPTVAAGRPGWPALRDARFLAVGAAAAVLSLHRVVLVLVVPLWIAYHTHAPRVVVSAILVTNTALTVLLAVRIGRGAQTAVPAARAMRRAGFVLAATMLLIAAAAGPPAGPAVALLLLAAPVYTIGDLLYATGSTGLSYDLARPEALGQYQGATVLLTGLSHAAGPALLTVALLEGGRAGWAALGALFVVAGLATPALTNRALAERAPAGPA